MTPWTITHQAPLSIGFSRQEYWTGLHFFLQGILLTQGSNPHLLHWQIDSFFFIYLFLAVMGLCCGEGLSSSYREQELLFIAVHRLLIVVVSLLAEHGL